MFGGVRSGSCWRALSMACARREGRINFMDTHARRKSQSQSEGEGTGDSSCGDDCRSSRSSTADSRKRRRRTALPETPGPDSLCGSSPPAALAPPTRMQLPAFVCSMHASCLDIHATCDARFLGA